MSEKQVVFTLDEVNQMLTFLGDVPAKYSLDLISFIRNKAIEQNPPEVQPSVETPPEA